jgi:hypothetical protein
MPISFYAATKNGAILHGFGINTIDRQEISLILTQDKAHSAA